MMISGGAGRKSSFEITIGRDGDESSKTVLYSKLKSGSFPDGDSVVAAIEQYMVDGSVTEIAAAPAGGCVVQ